MAIIVVKFLCSLIQISVNFFSCETISAHSISFLTELFPVLGYSCQTPVLFDPMSVNCLLWNYISTIVSSSQENLFLSLANSCRIPALLDPKSVNLMSVKVSQFPYSYPICYLIFITPLSVAVSGLMIIVDTVWLFNSSMHGCRGLAFDAMVLTASFMKETPIISHGHLKNAYFCLFLLFITFLFFKIRSYLSVMCLRCQILCFCSCGCNSFLWPLWFIWHSSLFRWVCAVQVSKKMV